MNIDTEIKKKEKSLTELMVRILKEPLKPIENLLSELNESNNNIDDKTKEIINKVNIILLNEEIKSIIKKNFSFLNEMCEKYYENILKQSDKEKEEFLLNINSLVHNIENMQKNLSKQMAIIDEMHDNLFSESEGALRYFINKNNADYFFENKRVKELILKEMEYLKKEIHQQKKINYESNCALLEKSEHLINDEAELKKIMLNLHKENMSLHKKNSYRQSNITFLSIAINIIFASFIIYFILIRA